MVKMNRRIPRLDMKNGIKESNMTERTIRSYNKNFNVKVLRDVVNANED